MSLMDFADSISPDDLAKWNLSMNDGDDSAEKKRSGETPPEIMELLGIAVGSIGMSYEDFCRCSVEEFNAIYNAWRESKESDERDAWEQMRLLDTISIQPHVKRKMKPQTLLPLPWDSLQSKKAKKEVELTSEQRKDRFRALINKSETCYHQILLLLPLPKYPLSVSVLRIFVVIL